MVLASDDTDVRYSNLGKYIYSTFQGVHPEMPFSAAVGFVPLGPGRNGGRDDPANWNNLGTVIPVQSSATAINNYLISSFEKPGNAVLMMTDHGLGDINPLNTGVSIAGTNNNHFTNENLRTIINAQARPDRYIRVVGVQCYSGGSLNALFDTKIRNVCGAASTNWLESNQSFDDMSAYGKAFLNEIRHRDFSQVSAKPSLLEAHIAGLLRDPMNGGLAQSSSLAFVDYVLREGAYSPSYIAEATAASQAAQGSGTSLRESNAINSNDKDRKEMKEVAADFEQNEEPIPIPLIPTETGDCHYANISERQSGLGFMEDMIHFLGTPKKYHAGLLSSAELAALPKSLQDAYTGLLRNPELKAALRRGPNPEAEKIENEYLAKKKHYDEQIEMAMRPPVNDAVLASLRANKNRDEAALEARLQVAVKPDALLFNFNRLVQNLRRVTHFLGSNAVSSEQKAKFADLLNCEMQPL